METELITPENVAELLSHGWLPDEDLDSLYMVRYYKEYPLGYKQYNATGLLSITLENYELKRFEIAVSGNDLDEGLTVKIKYGFTDAMYCANRLFNMLNIGED